MLPYRRALHPPPIGQVELREGWGVVLVVGVKILYQWLSNLGPPLLISTQWWPLRARRLSASPELFNQYNQGNRKRAATLFMLATPTLPLFPTSSLLRPFFSPIHQCRYSSVGLLRSL